MAIRRFLILTFCTIGTFAQLDPLVIQCGKELKIDLGYPNIESNFNEHTTEDERNCLMACMFRKGDKNAKNLYEAVKNSLNGVLRKPSIRVKTIEKLNKCNVTDGQDECKLMKCIDFFNPPFVDYFLL